MHTPNFIRLISCSVKPADGDDDAWAVDTEDSKLRVKEQYTRTTSNISTEYRYGMQSSTA